jgi:MoxR-like ATPase
MDNTQITKVQQAISAKKAQIDSLLAEIGKVVVGQKTLVNRLVVALFCRGHILLEGVPGLAKTTAISTLAKALNVKFQRIQFTPDLLPSDLVGSRIFNPTENSFYVKKGPIFANFILADEINRSPAKVQSALLEAMQEKQVTIGDNTFKLDDIFFVMATQNPIEQEGTYPLPEAQIDRFLLKTVIDYPKEEEEMQIIDQSENYQKAKVEQVLDAGDITELQELANSVYADIAIKTYIKDIVFASRNHDKIPQLKNLVAYGASPRASIGLLIASKAVAMLNGRAYVIPEDVKEIAMDVLRHRIIPTYEAEADGVKSEDVVKILLGSVRVP